MKRGKNTWNGWLGASFAAVLGIATGIGPRPALAQEATEGATESGGSTRGVGTESVGSGDAAERSEAGVSIRLPASLRIRVDERGEMVRVGSDALVREGERVQELVVVFGDATVDGEVDGDMVVVFGKATLNGRVRGDFVNVFGSAKFGPHAHVSGDCVIAGGQLDAAPGAQFDQQPVEVNFSGFLPSLDWLGRWVKSGLFLGRPLPPGVGWVWWIVALHFVLYLSIALALPKPVQACVVPLEGQLLTAFFVGLLGMIGYAVLMFCLTVTGVGALIVPFVWLAFVAARFIGKTAVFQSLGTHLLGRFNPHSQAQPLPALCVGFAAVTVVYMVPLLGLVLWVILRVLGLGVALMTAFEALRRNGNGHGRRLPALAGTHEPSPPALPPSAQPGADSASPDAYPTLASAAAATLPATSGALQELAWLPRAGFWRRLAASALDFVLVGLVGMVFPEPSFFLLLWLAYHVAMWSWKGTTLGGIVCGLKVVRLDGRPVDFTVALVRALGGVFSFVALGIGFFWAGWMPEKQSWHDMIAGTVIVKVPKGMSLI
ncbi:MAG: hypothetical protein FJ387_12870 [Verrucomicrobia bacterium]|nr:hypothetical protein [Verrucomicrobiota bacterium]